VKNPFEEYPVIEFKDIQKGDTIAAVTKDNNALKIVTGAANVKTEYSGATYYWYTEGGWITLISSAQPNTTIHLIDRPKPELPTKTGSVILVKKYADTVFEEPLLAIVDSAGDWFVPNYGKYRAVIKEWLITGKDRERIQEWTLAEVKEVTA